VSGRLPGVNEASYGCDELILEEEGRCGRDGTNAERERGRYMDVFNSISTVRCIMNIVVASVSTSANAKPNITRHGGHPASQLAYNIRPHTPVIQLLMQIPRDQYLLHFPATQHTHLCRRSRALMAIATPHPAPPQPVMFWDPALSFISICVSAI
jgi:hypothetical protein